MEKLRWETKPFYSQPMAILKDHVADIILFYFNQIFYLYNWHINQKPLEQLSCFLVAIWLPASQTIFNSLDIVYSIRFNGLCALFFKNVPFLRESKVNSWWMESSIVNFWFSPILSFCTHVCLYEYASTCVSGREKCFDYTVSHPDVLEMLKVIFFPG